MLSLLPLAGASIHLRMKIATYHIMISRHYGPRRPAQARPIQNRRRLQPRHPPRRRPRGRGQGPRRQAQARPIPNRRARRDRLDQNPARRLVEQQRQPHDRACNQALAGLCAPPRFPHRDRIRTSRNQRPGRPPLRRHRGHCSGRRRPARFRTAAASSRVARRGLCWPAQARPILNRTRQTRRPPRRRPRSHCSGLRRQAQAPSIPNSSLLLIAGVRHD